MKEKKRRFKKQMYLFFLAGFLGGIIRGGVGIIKYTQSYKDIKLSPLYLGITLSGSGLIGLICAWITKDLGVSFLGMETLPLSFAVVIGYAGGDFIENIFKIIVKEPDIFQFLRKVAKKKENEN